jgi:HKD family nuclease
MKALTTPVEISENLIRLIGECSSCQVAVAWASARFQAFSRLVENHQKIERMIVGLHFHQTDPGFIEAFLSYPNRVRYVRYTDGVFHPKVYLFEKAGGVWECIIGSPNFTRAGFSSNDEMAVLVTNQDQGASEALAGIKASICGYWLEAEPLSQDNLDAYRKEWRRKRSSLETLQTPLGSPGEPNEGKGKPIAPGKPLQKWTWEQYYG